MTPPTIIALRAPNSVNGHARRVYLALDEGEVIGIHDDAREAEALYSMRGAGIRAYVACEFRVEAAEYHAWRRGAFAGDVGLRFIRANARPRGC